MEPKFDFSVNPDTGEMEVTEIKPEDKSAATDQTVTEGTEQQQQQDPIANLTTRIDQLAMQNQQLGLLLENILRNNVVQQKEEATPVFDDAATESLFGDSDRGQKFINGLITQIETIVDNKFKTLQPLVNQQNVQNEFQQLASITPDIQEYIPGMYQALNINGNLSFAQAYQLAKQLGWRVQSQQNQSQQSSQPKPPQSNVTSIQRKVPNKLQSDNPQLNGSDKSSKEYNLKNALEDAAEELGIAL